MPASLTLRILPYLVVVFALLVWAVIGTRAIAQRLVAGPANEPYSVSYSAGGYDARGNFLGGTELMNLADFEGKLYAGIGYWMDRPQVFSAGRVDPPSGAQIIVLDSKLSQWHLEYAFNQRGPAGDLIYRRLSAMEMIQFQRANAGGPVAMLVAGLDGGDGGVYTRKSAGVWEDTRVPTRTPTRSLAVHYDSSDGREKLFAAPGGGEDKNFDRAIYAGVYDPAAPGRIRWDPAPERVALQSRIMSMTECGGALYAAAKPSIFRRNDARKSWDVIYSYPISNSFDESRYASGFRGLTCITEPDGKKALLSGFEGTTGQILRIDAQSGAAAVELDTRQFLTRQWGAPPARPDIIAGYNDIPLVKTSPTEIRLFGLLARSPIPAETNAAWLLSRTASNPPRYALHEVHAPVNWPYTRSDGALWSVRAITVSPFSEDQGQVLFLGGYDGHFEPDHNTAWLYRVGVDTALSAYRE